MILSKYAKGVKFRITLLEMGTHYGASQKGYTQVLNPSTDLVKWPSLPVLLGIYGPINDAFPLECVY